MPGIGLVGCGSWGAVHAHALQTLGPRVQRYFLSRDSAKAREFAARYQGEAIESFEVALSDPRIHALVICLPHHLHAGAACQALAAGKHTLVEKPIALTVEDGERMLHEADSRGLCLAVADQYRLSPLVARAKQIIDEGRLGRIIFVNAGAAGVFHPPQAWRRQRDSMGGGVLIDAGIHYVDVLRFWFGDPNLIWATTPRHLVTELQGEDSICLTLRFPDGPVADLNLSWAGFRTSESPNFEVVGERGSLALRFRRSHLVLASPLGREHWSRRLKGLIPWRMEQRLERFVPRERRTRIRVPGSDLLGSRAVIEDFVHAITTGAPPAVPGAEGLEDLEVVLAAYESLRRQAPMIR